MTQPIHPDIPVEKAWKTGRRICVVAGYKSQLNTELRDLGAKWDADERALWVGSGKLDQVLPLIRAQAQRVEQAQQVKAEGRWVDIPYDATDIRAAAKKLGARWDRERKQWAMPSDEAQAEIQQKVDAWKAQRAAKREQQREQKQQAASRTPEEIIAAAGRTATGETGKADGQLHGRMRRPQAETEKPQVGEIRQLKSGQRVIVLESRVDFMSEDAVEDMAPHLEPGWYYSYRYAVVEPTDDERADDAQREAERADEAEIAAVMDAAAKQRQSVTALTRVTGSTITLHAASGRADGTVTLTEDGRAIAQHPGYYDMYIETEATLDAALTERVRAIVAGGARRRGQYEVRP